MCSVSKNPTQIVKNVIPTQESEIKTRQIWADRLDDESKFPNKTIPSSVNIHTADPRIKPPRSIFTVSNILHILHISDGL